MLLANIYISLKIEIFMQKLRVKDAFYSIIKAFIPDEKITKICK